MEPIKSSNDKSEERGESSTPMNAMEAKLQQQMESVNTVLNVPLLLDKIVKYSLHVSNGKRLNKQAIVGVRLVNKSFLQSASRVLKKSCECIYKLEIGSGSFFTCENITKIIESEKLEAKRFVSVFSKSCRSKDSIVPIYLRIDQPYLTQEKSTSLINLLEQLGDIISALWITYPVDDGSLNLDCTNLGFPILHTLEFKFGEWRDPETYESKHMRYGDNANGLKFLQHILNNSKNLRRFQLMVEEFQVVNFGSISLPKGLKYLYLCFDLNYINLDLINKNHLSNLNALEFCIGKQAEVPLMYKVLQNFQKHITSLCVNIVADSLLFAEGDEDEQDEVEELPICIELPVMEKLKQFKIFGGEFDLIPEIKHVRPTVLPNVTQLSLENSEERIFLDWAKGSRFDNVKKFKLSFHRNRSTTTTTPNEQTVGAIISIFPNIEKLTLKIRLDETRGLKYLFRNFTHLKKIRFDFNFTERHEASAYKLVSLLLGISLERAAAIIDKTAENVTVEHDNPESIMNLTELESLTLWAREHKPYNKAERKEDVLCSRILTKYGFNKMPKLIKTKFLGGFKPNTLDA